MPDSRRTWAALAALYANNTAGAISPQDLRDGFASIKPHVASDAPTASDDETLGFDVGHEWLDTSEPAIYKCRDASTGAAAWEKVWPQSGAGGGAAAEDVTYDNTSSGLAAEDVQAAIDELASEKADASSLATVATSGSYNDLADRPTLGTAAAADIGDFATAAQGSAADSAVQPGDPISINAQTGTSYTLVLADAGKLVTLSNGSAITLTIPTNASVGYPTGTVIAIAQLGAGTVTIQGDTGVTVNGASAGSEDLSGQYATAALTKLDTNTWLVSGALAE